MSISGKYLTAKIGTTVIANNYAWTAEEGGDVLDRTVGTDLGMENEDMGVHNLHVTIKGYMDVAAGEYAPVQRGTIISGLNLFRAAADLTPAYAITTALVVRSTQGGEVRGKIEWSAEVHSKGNVVTYADPA